MDRNDDTAALAAAKACAERVAEYLFAHGAVRAAALVRDSMAPLTLANAIRDTYGRVRPGLIAIEIEQEDVALLQTLARSPGCAGETAADALAHLASSAADGVRRPGSWERAWIQQAFGEIDESALEVDPTARWRRRPAGGGR